MIAASVLAVTACGDNVDDDFYFAFDDRQLLCGFPIDDYINKVDWNRLQRRIDVAVAQGWILNVYAHVPGATISYDSLERAFTMFESAQLRWTTYQELAPSSEPYAGVAFAFDDDSVDAWFDALPLFERHRARVTFFVSSFAGFSFDQRWKLHELADRGNAIEAHTVHHADALEYSAAHGVSSYVNDEVLPSLQALRDDGFAPQSFAYPYGSRSTETDRAIEPYVGHLRTTPGYCAR